MMSQSNQITDPKVVELLKALGRAYLENGENEKATDKFKQLYEQNFEDSDILINYAIALSRLESVSDEDLRVYAKAITAYPNNEDFVLKLAELFLKKEITSDPALRIFHKSLGLSPSFAKEIKVALGKIFEQTSDNLSISEIKQTLLEAGENPELLTMFLNTAYRDRKYDEALAVLKELYARSDQHESFTNYICQTLLLKKASTEELNQPFILTPQEAHFCLKGFQFNAKMLRIRELESYLDYKNLMLSFDTAASQNGTGEYEVFLLDSSIDTLDEVNEKITLPTDLDTSFSISSDVFGKLTDLDEGSTIESTFPSNGEAENANLSPSLYNFPANTVALFEVTNYDENPESSKLPFQTFLELAVRQLSKIREIQSVATCDGIIALATTPRIMIDETIETLEKLERYNMVVDQSEVIHLRVTLHCTPIAFTELEAGGIRELRKVCKIHNFVRDNMAGLVDSEINKEQHVLLTSEQVTSQVSGVNVRKSGPFRFAYFPQEHFIYQIQYSNKNVTQPTTEVRRHFGKYEVSDTLKESHICSTYRGYDPQLERPVIIKAYEASAFAAVKEIASLRKQFYEEIRKLNRINHPNIGVIYDAGEEDDILYLVREFIEGPTLRQFIAEQINAQVQDILEICVTVARVLSHYHKSNIWHKNLKPENIFVVGAHREIKVVDGGLLQLRGGLGEGDEDLENIAYSTPEQLMNQKISQSCDHFQLATILYETIGKVHPFRQPTAFDTRMQVLNGMPAPLSSIAPEFPSELDAIIAKALSKEPEQRYASISDFEKDILALIDDSDVSTRRRMFELLK